MKRRNEITEPQQISCSNSKYIPIEVTAEILSRLPIKSIGRFISVSKSWRDVIVDRSFSSLHAKNKPFSTFYCCTMRSRCEHYLFEVDENGNSTTTALRPRTDEPHSGGETEIVGSCNGLLCLLKSRPESDAITILNPITNQSVSFTVPNRKDWIPELSGKEYRRVGESHKFCYSPSTDEYKVFKYVTVPCKPHVCCAYAIFTVGVDRGWRELPPRLFSDKLLYHNRDAVFCNGALHWLVNEDDPSSNHILAFDVGREDTRRMPIRRAIERRTRLSVFEDRISLYNNDRPDRGGNVVEWDVDGSWSQIVVPTRFPIRVCYNDYEECFEPLHCATKYGGVLLAGVNWGRTWLYCPKQERRTDIRVCRYRFGRLFEFAPTFLSIEEILHGRSSTQRT